jgi:UDP-N-acetylglucosamine 4,6-dehydratase/5-epimerase
MSESGMNMLVTGGTGFFGRAFVRRAMNEGASRICVYSRGEHTQAQMRADFNDDLRLRWFIGDVRDRDRLRRAMEGVEVVVHAAALKRIEVGFYNPEEMVKTNVVGAMNVIEAAADAGVRKVVALSTDKAFEPVSPYGQSKAIAETLFLVANDTCGANGPRFAIVRYGNVAGSTGSVIPLWKNILKSADTVPVTDPNCTRFFMTIDQAVDLVVSTIKTMCGGETVVPTLPAYRLGDLAQALGAKMDVRGLGKWEKLAESMQRGISSDKARRMSVEELRGAVNDL